MQHHDSQQKSKDSYLALFLLQTMLNHVFHLALPLITRRKSRLVGAHSDVIATCHDNREGEVVYSNYSRYQYRGLPEKQFR